MKTARGVEMLTLTTTMMGSESTYHPALIWDGDTVILVDTGLPGMLPQIRQAVEAAGAALDQVRLVIITHHDLDHIGSLGTIREELGERVKVLAHAVEKEYITGAKTPVKMAQMEANLESLPEGARAFYDRMKQGFAVSHAAVDETLTGGQQLPYCGGITVIETPGHTPGHICLYLPSLKTLIAGDALLVEAGDLRVAPAHINYDMDQYRESLRKLAGYDIETVICYHGGIYQGPASQRIAELAELA